MYICGYQKTTLLDYPGHVAATIFTGGCNFRCQFCHNPDLLPKPDFSPVSESEIFSFLQKRKNVLSGICITGGEPTLQSDLADFIKKARSLGYKIKLDTNGYRPEILKDLVQSHLLDYIAMDIKSGLSGYSFITGIENIKTDFIKESITIIENAQIPYEFRTTVVDTLHTQKDFFEIRDLLSKESPYYLQSFVDSGNILTSGLSCCDINTLKNYLSIVQEKLPKAKLRSVE